MEKDSAIISHELLQKISDELHIHRGLLENHKTQISLFFKTFQDEQERAKLTGSKIDGMQTQVSILTSHLSNLSQLPFLTKAIEAQGVATKELRESLVAPATGNNRTDNKTLYLILALFGAIVFLLISVIMIERTPDGKSLNAKGRFGELTLENNNYTQQPETPVEKKTK